MHQLRRLFANGLHNARMRMPERIHPQPGHEIEVAIALDVIDKNSLAPAQHERIAVISLQQILPFQFRDLFKSGHKKIRFYRKVRAETEPSCGFSGKQTKRKKMPK